MRQFAAATLTMQAIVLGLATAVLVSVVQLDKPVAMGWGFGAAGLCLLATGLLRFKFGCVLGWVCQVATIAMGFVTTSMFALGAIFLALWIAALRLGRRVDEARNATAS